MTAMANPMTAPADRGQKATRFSSGFWQLLWMIRGYFGLMVLAIVTGVLNQGATIAAAALGAYMVG